MIFDQVFSTTLLALTIGIAGWYSYLAFDFIQLRRKRLKVISDSTLHTSDLIGQSIIYLGSKLTINQTTLTLYDRLQHKLFVDKKAGFIEYKRFDNSRKIEIENIEFLIYEYLSFFNVTIHQFGKSIWVVNILIKHKDNDNPVLLVELKDTMDNAFQRQVEQPIDDKLYFNTGLELTRTISSFIKKPYKIIDEEKIKTSANIK
jgi:hypothetical protein